MRICCIQHEPWEIPGQITTWAERNGHTLSVTHIYQGETLPEPSAYEMLVILGGTMNVYEEEKHPWLAEEKHWIEAVIEAGKTVLGICLGAQLIATVLGGRVSKNPQPEIGWFPVTLTEEARKLPLFKGISPSFISFHWHYDTFTLPEGAVLLASSEGCPNQGFLYGERVVGLQFHPEINGELMAGLLDKGVGTLPEGPFVQTVGDMLYQDEFYTWETQDTLNTLLDNLVAYCHTSPNQALG